jgi:hypothetical protein
MSPRIPAPFRTRHVDALPLGILCAVTLSGCTAWVEPIPTLETLGIEGVSEPRLLVSGAVPVPQLGGTLLAVDPELFGGLGNAAEVSIASAPGVANVPGATLFWPELKDLPIERRGDFLGQVDATLSQLQTAMLTARLTESRPGMEQARVEMMRQLETAIADLQRRRGELELVQPEGWEPAKEGIHESWLQTQAAFSRARATGN